MKASRLLRPALPARYAYVVLALLSLAVGAIAIIFASSDVNHLAGVVHKQDQQAATQATTITQLRTQLQASCAVAADVGMVPLPLSPKPSKLGVSLVVDFRHQWRTLHCAGSLPVPPGLAHWAAVYGLPGN